MCRFRWLKVQQTCEIQDSNSSVAENSSLLQSYPVSFFMFQRITIQSEHQELITK